MKSISQTTDGRKVEYEESFWTGKKSIKIDGNQLIKLGKKVFVLDEKKYELNGNFIFGATLSGSDEKIVLVRKLNVLEWILVALPLILVFIGGALGGALGVLAACCNAVVVRGVKNIVLKIVACLAIAIVTYIIWFVIAMMLIS